MLGYLAIGVVILMMLLTVSDVFMRYLFAAPITGTTEITEYMMVCLIVAMAWTAVEGKHVVVDLVMKLFPKRFQTAVDSINLLVCLGIYVIICWQTYVAGTFALRYNVKSALLEIPEFPFYLVLAVGFAMLCVAIVPLLIKKIGEAVKK
jgi:TRAP-type C4-dicarboxylate transport system permease small subunit